MQGMDIMDMRKIIPLPKEYITCKLSMLHTSSGKKTQWSKVTHASNVCHIKGVVSSKGKNLKP